MASQNRATTTKRTENRTKQNISYLHGSAAPKYEPTPQRKPQRDTQKKAAPSTRKNTKVQAKPSPVNAPLLALTLVVFVLGCALMIHYISLNSQITMLKKGNQGLERQISSLKDENDEYYGRIMSNVNLDHVREVAVMDLGMVYASEGQIITYDSKIDDYVEQSRVIKD